MSVHVIPKADGKYSDGAGSFTFSNIQNEMVFVSATPFVKRRIGPVAVNILEIFKRRSIDMVGQQSGITILNISTAIFAPSRLADSNNSFGILAIAPENKMNCPPKFVKKK